MVIKRWVILNFEEVHVNNDLEESQLENLQYKLSQRNVTFIRKRSHGYIEREMPGTRKEIPKGELITGTGIPKGK